MFLWIQTHIFIVAPLALLVVGICLRAFQHAGGLGHPDSWFFGSEMSLSAIGSLLGALTSGKFDAPKTIELIYVTVVVVIGVFLVTLLHKHFEHLSGRPNLRFFMLGIFSNALAFFALSLALHNIKG